MTITLTSEQEKFIADQVESGHYQSAVGVVTQSLGLLRAQEEFIHTHANDLREKIAIGWEQAQRGELLDGPAAIQTLREKLLRRGHGGK